MAVSSLSPRLGSSPSSPEQKHFSFPVSLISFPQRNNLHFSKNLYKFSTWNGLKQLNMPTSPFILKLERKRRCKGVFASLFGVGAPEALVIGVVALLVFGPKGLAEVARNLGKTLRDFQPTIRELQEVSRDFKSTLEREIGLDEIQETTRRTPTTRPTAKPEDFVKDNTPTDAKPTENKAYTSEEYLSSITEQLKRQREKEASESLLNQQVTDVSAFSKEAETQEYLKQLEEQVQTLLAEKQKQTSTAEVKPEDTLEDASESPSRNSENQA